MLRMSGRVRCVNSGILSIFGAKFVVFQVFRFQGQLNGISNIRGSIFMVF